MNMQTVQSLYYKRQVDYILRYDVHPCTEADILFLEGELGFVLPATYKTFLRRAGRQPNDFFGEDVIPFRSVLSSIDMARAMIQQYGLPASLLDNSIVVGMGSQGYSFEIIRISEGDSVFQYMEGEISMQKPFVKIANSYWEYMYKRLFSQIKIEKTITKITITDVLGTANYQQDVFALVEQVVLLRLMQRLEPAKDQEIVKMAQYVQGRLPKIYKEFLKWSGHGLPNLLDMYMWHVSHLELLQSHIYQTLRDLLSPYAYVFLVYPGNEEFDIFYVNEGDDPPVYHCKKDGEGLRIIKTHETFSEYLIQAINAIR